MERLDKLKEIIEQDLSEYLGHEGSKEKALDIIDEVNKDLYDIKY